MKALARSVSAPNHAELEEMIRLLDLTDRQASGWPVRWSPDWFRQLAQSESWNAENLCCTSALDDYTEDFIHEMAVYSLRAGKITLFEWLVKRLDARTLPDELWALLRAADSIIQLRCLTKLPYLDELEGEARTHVRAMLAESEPHFWMYDHNVWYTTLSRKWCIAPPLTWWHLLYTLNLHRPYNSSRSLLQHYRGHTSKQTFQITGRITYSESMLLRHRSEILSQDPWAIVRSAFYGDTEMWPIKQVYDESKRAMYIGAYTVLMHYYPNICHGLFQESVPESIRQATPRVEFMMFVGMASGPLAADAFSSWLAANGGKFEPLKPVETFSLDNVL